MDLITQGIGFVALIVALLVFQANNRKKMLMIQMVSAILYTIHFFLLGALTGSVLQAIGALRSYIFSKRGEHKWVKNKFWLYYFIAFFVIVGLLTFVNYFSILPIIGMITGTIAFWLKNPRLIRLVSLIAPPCWFIYSFVVGSYPGMANELLMFSTVVVGIVRFDILKKDKLLTSKKYE